MDFVAPLGDPNMDLNFANEYKPPPISVASQNLRSLNISTKNKTTRDKIFAITKEKFDVILLCDLKLNSSLQKSAVHDVEKYFLLNGYKFYHNSVSSVRGVGILISCKLSHQIHDRRRDNDGNILLLDVIIEGKHIILGSLYGPNRDEERFFYNLSTFLTQLNCKQKILGGDMNLTWDNRPANINLDTLNMVNTPSIFRTNKLREICNNFNLVDPYRSLHPNRSEYTYVPSAVNNQNRSRIDFFMINVEMLPLLKNCIIPHNLLSIHFDHKLISLSFKKPKNPKIFPISNRILKEDELNWSVKASVIESYIQHAELNINYTAENKAEHLLIIGQILICIQESLNLKLNLADLGINPLLENLIAAKKTNIELLFLSLPLLSEFEALVRPDYCNDVLFFDTLIHCVRNGALLQQKNIFLLKNRRKNEILNRIKALKENYSHNQREINLTERILNNLIESELKAEILLNKKFEVLNDEKMTAHFFSLSKISGSSVSIADIRNDNLQEFDSSSDRSVFIKNYFKDVYVQTPRIGHVENCIENFLGDTNAHPVVNNAKLSEAEKISLDLPLTALEFEQSINSANMKSAPGADGFSNKFIKHFWDLFKTPLLKYANACYENGNLSSDFRRAKIRLIPKKGNPQMLKNWRPISLLNCFYKCISRVIATRLKKYMDKLTPTAQKGYSKTRMCQEVLLSVVDTIANCKSNKKRGAVLSLDIRKAFDTINHQYLEKVYDFFNLGPCIKRWLALLGTNRQACIILEDDLCTEYFDLERGNAQGDNISPFTFNLGYQILLFKLQYDLQIDSIVPEPDIPGSHPPLHENVSTDIPRVYGLADDATVLTTMQVNSLRRVKEILEEFGTLSGLECNVEKTTLMQIGSNLPIEPEIVELGFDIQNNVTLLGLIIENDSNNF